VQGAVVTAGMLFTPILALFGLGKPTFSATA
jgi:hypothetical protein